MVSRRHRAEPLMKPYVVIGNYNNGIRFVLTQCTSAVDAIDQAARAKRRDERRAGRGARLKTFIFKLHLEV